MEYVYTYSSVRCSEPRPDGVSKDGASTNSLGNQHYHLYCNNIFFISTLNLPFFQETVSLAACPRELINIRMLPWSQRPQIISALEQEGEFPGTEAADHCLEHTSCLGWNTKDLYPPGQVCIPLLKFTEWYE